MVDLELELEKKKLKICLSIVSGTISHFTFHISRIHTWTQKFFHFSFAAGVLTFTLIFLVVSLFFLYRSQVERDSQTVSHPSKRAT